MGDFDGWNVYCGECALKVDDDPNTGIGEWPPCPECGSRTRSMRPDGPTAGRIMLGLTALKRPGEKRHGIEERHGDSLQVSTGRWVRRHRVINRRTNRYHEKIIDEETREVIREVDEPLTNHQGRGNAKPKRDARPDAT
jgi:hypothetical protein